jgi:CubicO group peptidase (beta-lactamase class C family)
MGSGRKTRRGIRPLGGQTRLNTWSVAKSFVSVGVGIAMAEGLLRSDTRLCDVFPERVPQNAGENLLSVTVRDMLTMTTGLETPLFLPMILQG